jgi:hypothetical protein
MYRRRFIEEAESDLFEALEAFASLNRKDEIWETSFGNRIEKKRLMQKWDRYASSFRLQVSISISSNGAG